jgi:prevent-host-death family protein
MSKPKIVNVHAAKTHLSDLIKRAGSGQEVIIARDGVPVAKLVPIAHKTPKRQFGALAGRLTVTPSFFEPLPDDELAGWSE